MVAAVRRRYLLHQVATCQQLHLDAAGAFVAVGTWLPSTSSEENAPNRAIGDHRVADLAMRQSRRRRRSPESIVAVP